MCIIGLKESGIKPIEEKTFEQCWLNNGDGAGYALWDHEKDAWKVRKGFMTFKDFMDSMYKEEIDENTFYLVHFRFATSGNKDGGNTHPFPLFKSLENMRKTSFYTKYLAIHNGVCGIGDKIYSDTMMCIDEYINPLWKAIIENKKYKEGLTPILAEHMRATKTGSKWILTNKQTAHQFGEWVTDDNGVDWSNDMYKLDNYSVRHPNKPLERNKVTYTYTTKHWDGKKNCFMVWDWQAHKDIPEDDFRLKYPHVIINYYGNSNHNNYGAHSSYQNKRHQVGFVNNQGLITGADIIRSVDHSNAYVTNMGTLEWEDAKNEVFMNIMCPECFDDSSLEESNFIDGDIICDNCGTIFKKDTGEIIERDPEIASGKDEIEVI